MENSIEVYNEKVINEIFKEEKKWSNDWCCL